MIMEDKYKIVIMEGFKNRFETGIRTGIARKKNLARFTIRLTPNLV